MARNKHVLGFELSTQSAKWIVLDTESGTLAASGGFEFDTHFPSYGTHGGVLESSDPKLRHAPPAMYLDALDAIFEQLRESDIDPGSLAAIKCDAQQHCTVYSNASLAERLARLTEAHSLVDWIEPAITRRTSPIWEDRTTAREAEQLSEALAEAHGGGWAGGGGPGENAANARRATGVEAITGNRAELRFPASQIIRWANESPQEFHNTAHIQLLSAWLTSILTGRIAPVDSGDGWGTNLNHLDIDHPGFSPTALTAAAKLCGDSAPARLSSLVGEMVAYDAPLGTISPYFSRRYGVSPDAVVLAATGDNPATLLGVGDGALVSMGSSYTVCGPMAVPTPSPDGSYNVFGYRPGFAVALTVITNGGKLHREFCDRFAGGDWSAYGELTGGRRIDPDREPLMLPYLSDESVPVAPAGIVRDGFDETDPAANVRALHLSQVASMRLHSRHLADVDRVNVVGGGAANPFLRQAIADAFDATVSVAANAEVAAPFGCALSAARFNLACTYEKVVARFAGGTEEVAPDPDASGNWAKLIERYRALERNHVG